MIPFPGIDHVTCRDLRIQSVDRLFTPRGTFPGRDQEVRSCISLDARQNLSHLLWLKGVTLETGAQPTMTKAELVEEVTQLGDLTRRDGEVIVDTIFDAVIGALKSGDKIEIRGFGSFRIRQRKPRIGRNPKTGAKVEVPAKRVPYFKPSKELRDLVNPHEAAGKPTPAPPEH
jgi:integration host factor subunit beta